MLIDRVVSNWLFSGATYCGKVEGSPSFETEMRKQDGRRWRKWVVGWWMREVLALRIWLRAILGGNEVVWRGRRYRVSLDARVVEVRDNGREDGGVNVKRES